MTVRAQIALMERLGRLPNESGADVNLVKKFEDLYRAIPRPVSDDEARVLVRIFGDDDCFGLASSLMHLIETAPGWPLKDCLIRCDNMWITELRRRANL